MGQLTLKKENGTSTNVNVSGTLVVGSDTSRKPIQVKSNTWAEVQFFTAGTEYIRIGSADGGNGTTLGDFFVYDQPTSKMNLIVKRGGLVSARTGFQVDGSTVIDSNSNLTNIGTITSGNIYAGNITSTVVGNNYNQVNSTNSGEAMHRYSNSVSSFWYVGIRATSQLVGTTGYHIYSTAAAQTVMGLTAGGELRAKFNVVAYYSDERLKTKVSNLDNALSKVCSLNGFIYVENDKARELGYNNTNEQVALSAQEVQNVLPQAVSLAPIDCEIDENGNDVSISGENYLTVDYAKLVPLLVEAIKELKQEIEVLKNGNNTN